jgi:LAS superfamily LD-carboxypeptidase LdcB
VESPSPARPTPSAPPALPAPSLPAPSLPALPADALVGATDAHLCDAADADRLGAPVHRDVVAPLQALRAAAAAAGFDLRLTSGFRGFARQASIWNRKVAGKLAVLDAAGQPIDIATLSDAQLMLAILRWSALPGASRHHWGTDVDVYDAAATPDGYEVQLIPAEVDPGGMHAPLHAWLDARIARGEAFGFYRPYDRDRGGVAPERWHLSWAPLAVPCLAAMSLERLRQTVAHADLALRDTILTHLPALYTRFVTNVAPAHLPSAPLA